MLKPCLGLVEVYTKFLRIIAMVLLRKETGEKSLNWIRKKLGKMYEAGHRFAWFEALSIEKGFVEGLNKGLMTNPSWAKSEHGRKCCFQNKWWWWFNCLDFIYFIQRTPRVDFSDNPMYEPTFLLLRRAAVGCRQVGWSSRTHALPTPRALPHRHAGR